MYTYSSTFPLYIYVGDLVSDYSCSCYVFNTVADTHAILSALSS